MTFLSEMNWKTGFIDAETVQEKGRELSDNYNRAEPFPHIVIDEFLPRPIIDMCLAEFDRARHDKQTLYNAAQERFKREFKPDELSDGPRRLFYAFNSRPFIQIIENITGINGLIPDPYYLGGGFHEIHTGGHLSIHADFNHHQMMHLERRINVLIYLNDDWSDQFGGQLELWDKEMKRCHWSILPLANRCVIFNTTSESNHGNPNAVNHPDGRSRKSIALYYYTATWAPDKRDHNTLFRARPGTADAGNRVISKMIELTRDLAPPLLWRTAAKMRRALQTKKPA